MIHVSQENLPWVLIGILLSALVTVIYQILRGHLIPSRIADQLRESSDKRAEMAEAGTAANTDSVRTLVESVEKLTVLAENQDKVLRALRDAAQQRARSRGGS